MNITIDWHEGNTIFFYFYCLSEKAAIILYFLYFLFASQLCLCFYVSEEIAYFFTIYQGLPSAVISILLLYYDLSLYNVRGVLRIIAKIVAIEVDNLKMKSCIELGRQCYGLVPLNAMWIYDLCGLLRFDIDATFRLAVIYRLYFQYFSGLLWENDVIYLKIDVW